MSFNPNFAQEDEDYLIGLVRKIKGCFNKNCANPTARKTCSKCKLAVYCSKECQSIDWKDTDYPHKNSCKIYCDNIAPKDETGFNWAVAPALYNIGLISEDILDKSMKDRADAFLEEAKRVLDIGMKNDKHGFRKATIGLSCAVVYNMGLPRLQCAASVHDSLADNNIVTVNHIVFEVVGEGGEDVRKKLHPSRGSGEISDECRERVILALKSFFERVKKHGIKVQSVNFGRGLMWMGDDEFNDAKKELHTINSDHWIIWMPDVGYQMDDMAESVMGSFGSFLGYS